MLKANYFKPLHKRYEIDERGCWIWTAGKQGQGYPVFSVKGKHILAHRYFYEFYHSTRIPPGMQLDHLCRRPACVNPYHLEPVTHQENAKRHGPYSFNSMKIECPEGHPYSGDNLRLGPNGERYCRTCNNLRSKAFREKHKRTN